MKCQYHPAEAARGAVRAVIVMRRAVIIVLLLLRLMRLTSALRLAGRRAVDGVKRLMTAALVRPVIPV